MKDRLPTSLDQSFFAYNDNYLKAVQSVTSLSEEKSLMFQNNVTQLAAAKSEKFKNLKAKLDPEQQKSLAKTFNRYQAAEYNAIVHRARVADQWQTFQGERHLYPNIQWIRSRSANPREAHLIYAGRIWPMDDPFWASNSPGCVWNCKCSWRTTDASPTDNSNVIPAQSAPGLEGNPFITDQLITKNHPYFEGIDKHIPSLGVLTNPDDICYIPKTTKRGVKYKEHYLATLEKEISNNRQMVDALSAAGYNDIKLLPRINEREILLRERYYGDSFDPVKFKKCPDCIADGVLIEFKSTEIKNLSHNILKASKQGNVAAIKLNGRIDPIWAKRFCNKQFTLSDRKSLIKIILVDDNNNTLIYEK